MALFHTNGKFIKATAHESGTSTSGKIWHKCQVIIEQEVVKDTTLIVAFSCFGDEKIESLKPFKQGDEVSVTFYLQSREYNGKFYTDVNLTKIEAAEEMKNTTAKTTAAPKAAPTPAAPVNTDNDLPF